MNRHIIFMGKITTIKELKEWLNDEKKDYIPKKPYNGWHWVDKIVNESYWQVWKYHRLLRITEYIYSKRKNPLFFFLYLIVGRRKNKAGAKLGIYIPEYVFDKGLEIDHYGSIIVNGRCKVGKNCRLHGNNCIGSKGIGRGLEVPIIGDDFDLGFGATVVGDITIGNNVIVGANAVVTKNADDGAVLVGNPAQDIRLKKGIVYEGKNED